ncbi:MAG TPA: hypothetical protein VGJ81_13865 [Thermoanaerobaculia bacterium]|jgi:hypothetical protein
MVKSFCSAFILVVLASSATEVSSDASTLAQTSAPAHESALSNKDVVKLSKLQLGDDVIVAKIKQTADVDFDVSTDALIRLKEAGVSARVIAAMIDRTAPISNQPIANQRVSVAPNTTSPIGIMIADKEVPLSGASGDVTTTGFWPVVFTFLDYPGLHARVRTTNRLPIVFVRSPHDPSSYFFIGKLDVNGRKNNRSLKIEQKVGAFNASARVVPASHWQVAYDASETTPGTWRLTPRSQLDPGEYGIVAPGGVLFEFGID